MANQQTPQVSNSPVEGMMHVMRDVLLQLSGLTAILTFLTQMWNGTTLGQSLYTGAIVGGGVYIILLLVDVAFQRIIAAHVASTREEAKARAEAQKTAASEQENRNKTSTRKPANSTNSDATGDTADGKPSTTSATTAESPAKKSSTDKMATV